jgi:hypothetical protein
MIGRRVVLGALAFWGGAAEAAGTLATPPHYAAVKTLIDRIAELPPGTSSEATQARLFARLEALGPSAVPAMIELMDDRRPLRFRSLALTNKSPDAFEGRRFYGPELMVDAIAAVINQITGKHFGFICNGATEAERRAEVSAWRGYSAGIRPRTSHRGPSRTAP